MEMGVWQVVGAKNKFRKSKVKGWKTVARRGSMGPSFQFYWVLVLATQYVMSQPGLKAQLEINLRLPWFLYKKIILLKLVNILALNLTPLTFCIKTEHIKRKKSLQVKVGLRSYSGLCLPLSLSNFVLPGSCFVIPHPYYPCITQRTDHSGPNLEELNLVEETAI